MLDGIPVIDAHMHLFTAEFSRRVRERLAGQDERYRRAHHLWEEGFRKRYNSDAARVFCL